MTPTLAPAAARPVPRRWPLRLSGMIVGAALTVLWILSAIGLFVAGSDRSGGASAGIAMVAGFALALGWAAWKRITLFGSWTRVAAGAAIATAGFAWLGWDDAAFEHPLALDELSPAAGPGAAASHAVTLWYTEQAGHERRPFKAGKLRLRESPADQPAAWEAEIVQVREAIAAEWEALAPEREWFAAMDAFAALGDDTSAGFDAPVIAFAPFRRVTTVGAAYAGLLALEGRGDEAAEILRQQLSVCRKLERHSRSLVRCMVSMSGQRQGMGAARFVLERSSVSPALRAELAATIGSRDIAASVRQIVWLDFITFRDHFLAQPAAMQKYFESEFGSAALLGAVLRPVVFLPKNTANLQSAQLRRLEAAGLERDAARQAAVLDGWAAALHRTGGPRNFGGKYLLLMASPALGKVIDSSWKLEDQRQALLNQLRA